ncbi:MAG: diguanylate cyclase [Proteobacteria bacterium]|nr:diguanylate cyclase [Pseudomonadota bacterium]
MNASILIIDDSENQRKQIHKILLDNSIGSSFHEAADGLEGIKALMEQEVDLILCDLEMPGFDGFKFLAAKKNIEIRRDIPVIILTGNISAKNKIKGLEQGASDYVTKPFDPAELIARVNVHLKIKNLQDKLKESNEKLRELANTDALTGLSNRRVMTSELKKEFQRTVRLGKNLCFLMIDIDFFKKTNDSYGHQAGDDVLKAVADTMLEQIRPYDQIARFGGEEFAVILPETDKDGAVIVAERIRAKISELLFEGEMEGHQVTISTGISVLYGDNYDSEDDLINAADQALYRAKEGGRNRVEVA